MILVGHSEASGLVLPAFLYNIYKRDIPDKYIKKSHVPLLHSKPLLRKVVLQIASRPNRQHHTQRAGAVNITGIQLSSRRRHARLTHPSSSSKTKGNSSPLHSSVWMTLHAHAHAQCFNTHSNWRYARQKRSHDITDKPKPLSRATCNPLTSLYRGT